MNVRQAILDGAARLSSAGLSESRLESEVLLASCLQTDRTGLYARLEDSIGRGGLEAFSELVRRRLTFEPVAYILGKREFYGIELYVDRRVLIPRPETELLVEEALRFVHSRQPSERLSKPVKGGLTPSEGRSPPRRAVESSDNLSSGAGPVIADIGTGCGALAIALAMRLPRATIIATDISFDALEVARANRDRLGLADRVALLCGDALAPLAAPVDVLVANLPYIDGPDFDGLDRDIRDYEPAVALYGGRDGLDIFRRLVPRLENKVKPGGLVLLEAHPKQMPALEDMVRLWLPSARTQRLQDLAGKDRALRIAL